MGHSFHVGQEPYPDITQPFHFPIAETRRRLHIPQSLRGIPAEGTSLIEALLINKAPDTPHRERMSALSHTGSRGKKRSLDLFHQSSNFLKHLLCPRSDPPSPALTRRTAQQIAEDSVSSLMIIANPQIGYHYIAPAVLTKQGKLNHVPNLKKRHKIIQESTLRTSEIASTRTQRLNLPNAQGHSMEGDTFGIAKINPHLVDVCAPRQLSREGMGYSALGGIGHHGPLSQRVKQKAEQEQYGFASSNTGFSSKTPRAGTNNTRPGHAHISTSNSDCNSQLPGLSCELMAIRDSGAACTNSRGHPRKPTRPSSLNMSHGRSAQSARRLLLSSPKVPADEESSSEPLLSATFQAGSKNVGSIPDNVSPSPAPTVPLPPLPQGRRPRRVLLGTSHSSRQGTTRVSHIPQMRLGTPPPKPTARTMHIGDPSEDELVKRGANNLTVHSKTHGLHQQLKRPSLSRVSCEDPFEQRKIRTEKTQALKKRDLQHTRVLQKGQERGDKESYGATSEIARDTEETIILPSIANTNHSQGISEGAFARSSQRDSWGDWTFTTHKEAAPARKDSRFVVLDHEPGSVHSSIRPQYCNHSTQYSPPHKASFRTPLSPPLSPTAPFSKGSNNEKQSIHCPRYEGRRQSKPSSTSANSASIDTPEALPWYLSELESRLGTRLAVLERRTIMLEAALLAVINASARWGGAEARSEGLAPLESKLEAMVTGINGFGR